MNYYLIKFKNPNWGMGEFENDKYRYLYIREDSKWKVRRDCVAGVETFISHQSQDCDICYSIHTRPLYTIHYFSVRDFGIVPTTISTALFLEDIVSICKVTEEEKNDVDTHPDEKIRNANLHERGIGDYCWTLSYNSLDAFFEGVGLMRAATKTSKK